MDEVHVAIGVTSVVALIVIIANSISYVGGRLADQNRGDVSDLVTRGAPVSDQITAVEGEPPLVECDYMNATCSAVKSFGSTACAIIGPFLPELPSLIDHNKGENEAEDIKSEPDEKDGLAWADPPGDEE